MSALVQCSRVRLRRVGCRLRFGCRLRNPTPAPFFHPTTTHDSHVQPHTHLCTVTYAYLACLAVCSAVDVGPVLGHAAARDPARASGAAAHSLQ